MKYIPIIILIILVVGCTIFFSRKYSEKFTFPLTSAGGNTFNLSRTCDYIEKFTNLIPNSQLKITFPENQPNPIEIILPVDSNGEAYWNKLKTSFPMFGIVNTRVIVENIGTNKPSQNISVSCTDIPLDMHTYPTKVIHFNLDTVSGVQELLITMGLEGSIILR